MTFHASRVQRHLFFCDLGKCTKASARASFSHFFRDGCFRSVRRIGKTGLFQHFLMVPLKKMTKRCDISRITRTETPVFCDLGKCTKAGATPRPRLGFAFPDGTTPEENTPARCVTAVTQRTWLGVRATQPPRFLARGFSTATDSTAWCARIFRQTKEALSWAGLVSWRAV